MKLENSHESAIAYAKYLDESDINDPLCNMLKQWRRGEIDCDEIAILEVIYHFYRLRD